MRIDSNIYFQQLNESGRLARKLNLDTGALMTLISETVRANGPMANVGSLECVPLPEILKRITVNELSGSLDASAGGTVRTLYFDQGLLVFTASSVKKDRLGQHLLQAGKLTEDELDVAVRFMTNHRRIGQAIVAAGLLDEDEGYNNDHGGCDPTRNCETDFRGRRNSFFRFAHCGHPPR